MHTQHAVRPLLQRPPTRRLRKTSDDCRARSSTHHTSRTVTLFCGVEISAQYFRIQESGRTFHHTLPCLAMAARSCSSSSALQRPLLATALVMSATRRRHSTEVRSPPMLCATACTIHTPSFDVWNYKQNLESRAIFNADASCFGTACVGRRVGRQSWPPPKTLVSIALVCSVRSTYTNRKRFASTSGRHAGSTHQPGDLAARGRSCHEALCGAEQLRVPRRVPALCRDLAHLQPPRTSRLAAAMRRVPRTRLAEHLEAEQRRPQTVSKHSRDH